MLRLISLVRIGTGVAAVFVLFSIWTMNSGKSKALYSPNGDSFKIAGSGKAMAGTFDMVLNEEINFERMSLYDAQIKTSIFFTTATTTCKNITRFGKKGDGGYEVCMDQQYEPQHGNCIIYSFGVGNKWDFDDAAQQHKCEVHSFDPTIGKKDHIRAANHSFHNLGLWDKDLVNEKGWNLATLGTIFSTLKHEQKVIDVMKVDIEGAEWPFLQQFIQTDWPKRIKQLIFEIHTPTFKDTPMTVAHYMTMYNDLTTLRDKHSYQLYQNLHSNGCCGRFAMLTPPDMVAKNRTLCCYELYFVNTNYV